MRIKTKTAALLEAVSDVQFVQTRTSTGDPASVTLDAENGYLTVSSSDFELSVSRNIPSSVAVPGTISVSPKKLFSVIKSLSHPEVTLSVAAPSGYLQVSSAATKATLPPLLVSHSSPDTESAKLGGFTLPGDILVSSLARVHYASATEGSRYVCMGVYISASESTLNFVATDGRRVSISESSLEILGKVDCIVPSKTVDRLLKVLPKDTPVEVSVSSSKISFSWSYGLVVGKLIDGVFPNYKALLASFDSRSIAVVGHGVFLEALRRASIASSSDKIISLNFRAPTMNDQKILGDVPGVLGLTMQEDDGGSYADSIPLEFAPSAEETVSFNIDYLTQPLSSCFSPSVTFRYGLPNEAAFMVLPSLLLSILAPAQTSPRG